MVLSDPRPVPVTKAIGMICRYKCSTPLCCIGCHPSIHPFIYRYILPVPTSKCQDENEKENTACWCEPLVNKLAAHRWLSPSVPSGTTWEWLKDFHEILYSGVSWKSVGPFKMSLKSDNNNGHFTEDSHAFLREKVIGWGIPTRGILGNTSGLLCSAYISYHTRRRGNMTFTCFLACSFSNKLLWPQTYQFSGEKGGAVKGEYVLLLHITMSSSFSSSSNRRSAVVGVGS
jgi:hypothetical protein